MSVSYQYVQPTDEQKALMQKYRDKFQELSDDISANVENSRGKSSCLTRLEEASFWLNKGITQNS